MTHEDYEQFAKRMEQRFPKMFEGKCGGFAVGAGWYPIIEALCANIQSHIDWSVRQRDLANKYNEMAAQCKAGMFDLFEQNNKDTVPTYKEEKLARIVAGEFRTVPDAVCQVTVDQVKEKFGGLRFYYSGGDDTIDGMVRMAEAWADVACEECGAAGTLRSRGWIRTLCDHHEAQHQERVRIKQLQDEEQLILKQGYE